MKQNLSVSNIVDLNKINGNFISETCVQRILRNTSLVLNKHFSSFPKRYLVISDLHIPFHDLTALKNAISLGKRNHCDNLIIAGDFADVYQLSQWDKELHVSLKQEVTACHKMLEVLSKNFKNILLLTSNHEDRYLRYLRTRIDNQEYLDVIGKQDCLLDRIIKGIEPQSNPIKNAYFSEMWFVQIGDTIIAHPAWNVGKQPGALSRACLEYFMGMGLTFNTIITAHAHRKDDSMYLGKKLIEIPALCSKMDYMYKSAKRYTFNTAVGCALVDFDVNGESQVIVVANDFKFKDMFAKGL